MPIDVAEYLTKKTGPADPAAPVVKDDPGAGPGIDIAKYLAAHPKPPGAVAKVVKAVGAAAAPTAKWEGEGLLSGVHDATRQIYGALDQLKESIKEPGAEAMPLHGLKTAWDALNAAWSPGIAAIDVSVTQPIQALQQSIGNFLKNFAAEDDAQARREGQKYAKGVDWKVRKADVQTQIENIQNLTSAGIAALETLVGARGAKEMPLERSSAVARGALRDLKDAVTPPEPTLKPISVSLDNSLGFGKIREVVGPQLHGLPPNTTTSAGGIIELMLPHAEGYAKAFLLKLQEHIDPNVPVTFKNQVGVLGQYAGAYFPEQHRIEVSLEGDHLVHTAIHEIIHSTSVNMLDTLIDSEFRSEAAKLGRELSNGEKLRLLNNPSSPVLRELDQIIKEARIRVQKSGRSLDERAFYGLRSGSAAHLDLANLAFSRMTPRYEFVAEIFTNTELQEFLANSEKYASAGYKWKNMLNQFGNMIGRHLGMKSPHELQLLNQSLRVGSRMIEMQAKEKPPIMRGITEIVAMEGSEAITVGDIKRVTRTAPLHVEGTPTHPSPTPPTGPRWWADRGAIPGEPSHFLDGGPEDARAVLIEHDIKGTDNSAWEARLPGGRSLGKFDTVEEAAGAAEHHVRPLTEIGHLIDSKEVNKARTSLQISIEQILRTFSPESLGKNAKLAAAAIASRITEQLQKESAWRYGARTRLKFWRARPDMTAEFIEKFEKGENFSDPVLRDFARKYKDWGQRISARDKKLGIEYEPRENYLSHIFEDSEGVAAYFARKYGSKWGDPSFTKDRTFDLYKEAIAAGFKQRFDSPEDIMLARQHASDIAEMHIGILNDLASYGLAVRKIVSREELVKKMDAEGRMSLEVVKTEGTKRPPNTTRWRAPNGDVFWVDPQADAILQNAFKSKSLWEDKGGVGVGFRGMMALKNALVPIRLALSLFHPLHVAGIDIAAGWTRATTALLSGTMSPPRFLAEMLRSGFAPVYENPKAGWRVMNAWRGKIPKESLTPEDAKALETLIEMGMAPEMSVQYRTNARQNFANALTDARASFRMNRPLGLTGDLARATWHLPWAILSSMQKPIFEMWIPLLKAASALKDAKNLLERNPELIENDAARHLAMRKLGKSVENRYGEMNYNTLFWKRWMKDIAVLDTLSLGWQLGFIREYGGGAMDLGQWAKSGDKVQRIREGMLDRPIFVASYTALGAGMAGLMTWAMTGEQPTSLLDYISPRTGEKNPDGSEQRVSTMFYSREFAALYKHVQNEGLVQGVSQLVLNKGSGLFGLMHEMVTGLNGFGQEIRDPSSDAFTKLEQTLAYVLTDLEPISMQAIQKNAGIEPEDTALDKAGKIGAAAVGTKGGALSALGFTPAPKYLTESKTEADIKTAFRNYVAPKETPFEKAQYSKEYTQLREAYQSGSEKYGDLLDKMVELYELSGADQRRMIRSLNSSLPPTVRMFMRLPWQEQKKILDKASPEEVDLLLPHSNRQHVRNVWTPPQ